jgi:hypothetical protein
MKPQMVVSIASAAISLLALFVAYMADRRSKRNNDAATQLSFQTKKNEITIAVAQLRNANQGRVQQVLKAIEEFRAVAEEVEAREIPQLSEQAREFKIEIAQAFKRVENPAEADSALQKASETLNNLPAERATAAARTMLEAVDGKVQELELIAEQLEASATSIVSNIRRATDFYREDILTLTKDDEEQEDTVEEDTVEEDTKDDEEENTGG